MFAIILPGFMANAQIS